MMSRCAIPLVSRDEYRGRKMILGALIEQVNEGSYSPQPLHGFLSAPKANSVARFIPVFSRSDTAVYFACLQQIDRQLASAAVPDTFGGWQLGGARRNTEESAALELLGEDFSIPQSCYNRAAWVQNWNQFWKLLAARHEAADDSAWFAMFDVANFYDSVDLRRLETSVRAASGGAHFAINVLFHLLRNWNKAHCLYTESTKGLPMDVVGDCSRLLANFFLTSFDETFRQQIEDDGGHYMRFADDMVVRARSRSECSEFVYKASEELHRYGLNVNVAKVRYCSKLEFEQYWGFMVMDRFEVGNVIDGLLLLRTFIGKEGFGRKPTALKRAVTLASRLEGSESEWWKRWVREVALEEQLLIHLSREQLIAFAQLYDDPCQGLREVMPLFFDQPFTQPKAIFIRALQSFRGRGSADVSALYESSMRAVAELNDPVLNLCVTAAVN